MRSYFFTILLTITLNAFSSKVEGQVLVEDLSLRWIFLDKDLNQYFPVTYQSLSELRSISITISEEEFMGQQLHLDLPRETSVFLNQKIVAQTQAPVKVVWNIDSLRLSEESKSLFVTIYSPNVLEDLSTTIVSGANAINLQKGLDEYLPIPRRDFGQFVSFFIVAGLIVLVLISTLRRVYSKYFNDFYGFSAFFQNRIREDSTMRGGLLNPISLIFYSVHSLLLGLLLVALVRFYPDAPSSLDFLKSKSWELPWLIWILSSILIFGIVLLKYILISYFGNLFSIKTAQTGHFTIYMQMSLMFFLLVFIVIFVAFKWLAYSQFAISAILVTVLIFSFFRVLILFFKLMKQTSFRNLHLISYLCATELIPLLISIKLFL